MVCRSIEPTSWTMRSHDISSRFISQMYTPRRLLMSVDRRSHCRREMRHCSFATKRFPRSRRGSVAVTRMHWHQEVAMIPLATELVRHPPSKEEWRGDGGEGPILTPRMSSSNQPIVSGTTITTSPPVLKQTDGQRTMEFTRKRSMYTSDST